MQERIFLRKLKEGDENALAWFIDRYAAYVSTIIYNIAGSFLSVSDVEEISSDVFYTFWKTSDRVRYGKVKAYLSGIARNKAKEQARRVRREIPLEDDLIVISDDNIERDLEESEMARLIRNAVFELKHPDREIFLRYYYYYQTVADIRNFRTIIGFISQLCLRA